VQAGIVEGIDEVQIAAEILSIFSLELSWLIAMNTTAMIFPAHSAYPTLRTEREGWATRSLVVGDREKTDS
jgi:hypothetical protein